MIKICSGQLRNFGNRSGRALRPARRGYYDLSKSRSSKLKIAGGSTCIRANSEWTGLSRKLCSAAITKDGILQDGTRSGIDPPVAQLFGIQVLERRVFA